MKILAFGEIMLKLSAEDNKTIAESSRFEACYGGTEANVLACLHTLGNEVKYLSALPQTELGDAVIAHLESYGIDVSDVLRQGDELGMYFCGKGAGSRGSNVIYVRRHSEITKLNENSYDCGEIFQGADWFHISGISFALSESSRLLAFKLIKEAKRRGITVSFDFNYRAKLWTTEQAGAVFRKVMPYVDVALASSLDLSVFLNVSEENFFSVFPQVKYLVLRDRKVINDNKHSVKVTLVSSSRNAGVYESPTYVFPVKERVGGGDAFDGGIIHALADEKNSLKQVAEFALACFILKHTVKGDTFTLTAADIDECAAHLEDYVSE